MEEYFKPIGRMFWGILRIQDFIEAAMALFCFYQKIRNTQRNLDCLWLNVRILIIFVGEEGKPGQVSEEKEG